jgi:hypothetical protein
VFQGERIGIVAVFISSRNHHDPKVNDLLEAMLHLDQLPQINESRDHQPCKVVPAFDLPARQSGIETHLRLVGIEKDRPAIYG